MQVKSLRFPLCPCPLRHARDLLQIPSVSDDRETHCGISSSDIGLATHPALWNEPDQRQTRLCFLPHAGDTNGGPLGGHILFFCCMPLK